jgi:3D-(3,5/4)-trihydroxycyclohexane-1,2-dione acylhydrolase (decyclizing)
MMAQEIATAVQEGVRLTIVLFDNQGFGSIGNLSESVGCGRFQTQYRRRSATGDLDGSPVAVDFMANAASLGASVVRAETAGAVREALGRARATSGVTVIVVPVDLYRQSAGSGCWWDVPVPETSPLEPVRQARAAWERGRTGQRHYL